MTSDFNTDGTPIVTGMVVVLDFQRRDAENAEDRGGGRDFPLRCSAASASPR